ncbi:hypothetical protein GGX14DRAFT_696219 [Mycena pura]|uniref:ATP-grasp domain-containing protein n=1 Tax=Mycena pura TaxID=153505 RepID=A0AAD6VL36_9AGAR|nr:hypothetical protein GGX14DRAFT_696219 [Mycena pura]
MNAGGMHFNAILNMPGCNPVKVLWRTNGPSEFFQTIDVTLQGPYEASQRFFARCIALSVKNSPRHIKLIFAAATMEGFLGRRNFFERRLLDCPFAEEVAGFLGPERSAIPAKLVPLLSDLGAIIHHLIQVEGQLEARLAYPWLLEVPAPRYNVVLVEGLGFIQVVKDLNVALLVLGPEGPTHWAENPANAAGFCEAPVKVDLAFDPGLLERIAEAVRGTRGSRGRSTGSSLRMIGTSRRRRRQGCSGCPRAPVRAHEISTDKYAMRQFQADARNGDFQLFRFADVDDAKTKIAAEVDPGVARVNSDTELLASIGRVNSARHGSVVIVEIYIDGPEFDANFVLEGDRTGAANADFFETSELTPCALSENECDIVLSSLHKTLLWLKFTWGLYHIEGRRLVPRAQAHKPSCFLLEINTRVPGVGCSFFTIHSYGVDFYAVPLLACVGDSARLALLATPFAFAGRADGSQYWCQVVKFVQADRGGRLVSEDATSGALAARCSDLGKHIERGFALYKPGTVVPDPASGLLLFWRISFCIRDRAVSM